MECVAKNPSKRPDPAEKVKVLRAGGQYLKNDLIDTMIFLEEFQVIVRQIRILNVCRSINNEY